MRQAIVTKFLGPTNSRPARIKATAAAGSHTMPWDYSLNADANHQKAARLLVEKLGWDGEWTAGGLPDESGCVFVDQTALVMFKTVRPGEG